MEEEVSAPGASADGMGLGDVGVGEVSDISQRLSSLQAKRAEDKVRIKELEKYRAQYIQVRFVVLFIVTEVVVMEEVLMLVAIYNPRMFFCCFFVLDDRVQTEME